MFEQLPPETYQLGHPVAEYHARRFNAIGGPIIAACGLLLLVVGCQLNQSLILLGVLGVILLPFGVFIALFSLTQRNLRVVLFTDGFYYQQAKRKLAVQWQDIAFIHKRSTRNFINFIYAGKRILIQSRPKHLLELSSMTNWNVFKSLATRSKKKPRELPHLNDQRLRQHHQGKRLASFESVAQPAHPADRFAREILAISAPSRAARSRRLMRNSLGRAVSSLLW